ncbi:MAG: LytR/AlgR family response regulator transcription factor [Rhodothermaceae bacterium]
MKILIVEDVTLIAERVERLTKLYLKLDITKIKISHTLDDARLCIKEDNYDLLFLDLNLNGQDGFDLLNETISHSFKTIVITANKSEAARAFDLGIFDFISKPITKERFKTAMDRIVESVKNNSGFTNYISVKTQGKIELIDLDQVLYIKASGHYCEIYSEQNKKHLHDKNLEKIMLNLPSRFLRIHRSYAVNTDKVKQILNHGGGKYEAELITDERIPVNRNSYKRILEMLNI